MSCRLTSHGWGTTRRPSFVLVADLQQLRPFCEAEFHLGCRSQQGAARDGTPAPMLHLATVASQAPLYLSHGEAETSPAPHIVDFPGCRSRKAHPEGLKQQECLFSQFWRPRSPRSKCWIGVLLLRTLFVVASFSLCPRRRDGKSLFLFF